MDKTRPVDKILRKLCNGAMEDGFYDDYLPQAKTDLLKRLINELEKHKLNLGGMYNDAIEDCEEVLRKELE